MEEGAGGVGRREEEEGESRRKGRSREEGHRWQMSLTPLCVCVIGSMESWKASCREG